LDVFPGEQRNVLLFLTGRSVSSTMTRAISAPGDIGSGRLETSLVNFK